MTSWDSVFRLVDPPLWVVTSAVGEERGGLIATVVMKVSISEHTPRVVIGIGKQHHTWSLIERAGAFALHLFDEGKVDWVERFALASSRDINKFQEVPTETGSRGIPILTEAPVAVECLVESKWDIGDRTLYLGAVTRIRGNPPRDFEPLSMSKAAPLLPHEVLAWLGASRAADAITDAEAIRATRSDAFLRLLSEDQP